jgi:hypothetical protein
MPACQEADNNRLTIQDQSRRCALSTAGRPPFQGSQRLRAIPEENEMDTTVCARFRPVSQRESGECQFSKRREAAMPKWVNFFRLLLFPTVALALWSGPSRALTIIPHYDVNLSPAEQEVIEAGIASWTQNLAKGGPSIDIEFVANDKLHDDTGRYGQTRVTQVDDEGRPTLRLLRSTRTILVGRSAHPIRKG